MAYGAVGVNGSIYPSIYQQNIAAGQKEAGGFNTILAAKETKKAGKLQEAEEAGISRAEVYKKYLESKYGKVTIQSVGKDQAAFAAKV